MAIEDIGGINKPSFRKAEPNKKRKKKSFFTGEPVKDSINLSNEAISLSRIPVYRNKANAVSIVREPLIENAKENIANRNYFTRETAEKTAEKIIKQHNF